MGIEYSYKWAPIKDYESDPDSFAQQELYHLSGIWQDQKVDLENVESLEAFNKRLKREWAIETGLLERIYALDRGVTQVLIARGIDAALIPHKSTDKDPNKVAAMIHDHEAAIDSLFSFVKGDRPISTSYIKELHALLTQNQDTTTALDQFGRAIETSLLKGDYKKHPNNPKRVNGRFHEYCPPEHVSAEMDRLIELHALHTDVKPEVEAAWLHHRFTQIHPFQDGNGRIARCLATLVFLRACWFPLAILDTEGERSRYLDAMEAADRGNLVPLVKVFAALQKKAFVQALGISQQVLKLTRAEQVISATRDLLKSREAARRKEWENAKITAEKLQEIAVARGMELTRILEEETGAFLENSAFFVNSSFPGDSRSHYFRWQIIETAKKIEYFVNSKEYRAWTRIVLRTQIQSEILISFHGSGHEYRGILACSACYFQREETEDGRREIVALEPLSRDVFQINYLESLPEAEARFRDWLEDILVKGLEIWRRGL